MICTHPTLPWFAAILSLMLPMTAAAAGPAAKPPQGDARDD